MTETFSTLAWHDLQSCLIRAPHEVLFAMKKFGPELMVAGGYVRSCVSQEPINDVDLFCSSKWRAKEIAAAIAGYGRPEKDPLYIHETDNAFTIKGHRYPIQIIHRWTFKDPAACVQSFDFTIARAAFWWVPLALPLVDPDVIPQSQGKWHSVCDSRFYQDLAGKRLIYAAPQRNEDAGGSLLRVLKFYQRGYRIPLDSMGAVLGRLMMGVRTQALEANDEQSWFVPVENKLSAAITGLLREVDPEIDPKHIAHLPSENANEQLIP